MAVTLRTRAHIRLNNQPDALDFVQEVCKHDDKFSIENKDGSHRVNAKSIIGVMYITADYSDEMYLVNDTNDGNIPVALNKYRVL